MNTQQLVFALALLTCGLLSASNAPAERDPAGSVTYLSDMSQCLPAEALSTKPVADKWHVVDFDAGAVKGKMIAAQATVAAPDVRLPLKVKGWYAVSIGFWPGMYAPSGLKYRFSNEEVFTVAEHPMEMLWDRIDLVETMPRYADLTGLDLVLARDTCDYPPRNTTIAYVKLERLTDKHVETIKADRQKTDTRKLIACNDGEGFLIDAAPRTRNQLLEQVEIYRHSDVGKVLWGVNLGDLTYYQSSVGKFCYTENQGVYPTRERQLAAENYKALVESGVKLPFKEVLDHCHSMGIELHTYYRLVIADHSHPHNIFSTDSFFVKEHPEWRVVAKDGTPLIKASYAFPGVRDFMLSLIEEGMQYDIDGVNLCLIRGPEYFGYEKPVIDDFQKLYGIDPRTLPDNDPRLLKLRAGYMTEFVRAVRRAAGKYGKRRGRPIQVSTWIEWSNDRMLYFGYDCYTWVKEKLLDFALAAGPSEFVTAARENGCKVYGFGSSAGVPVEVHIQDMKHAYAAGLDGMVIWDINGVQYFPEEWAILSRLGHRDEVVDWAPIPAGYPKMKRMKLISVAGEDFAHSEYNGAPMGVPRSMLSAYTGG